MNLATVTYAFKVADCTLDVTWQIIVDKWVTCTDVLVMLTTLLSRPICFTNNTYSWFWEISTITCCPPFFTMATINDVPNNPHNSDPNNLDLYWMQTSGSAFLHEMMHANAITRERDHSQYYSATSNMS
jgi:hypothetical protein